MSPTRPSVLEPISAAELQAIDPDRVREVERRHELLVEYLALRNLQGLLLLRPENFAWLTFGGDNTRRGSSRTTAALFVTPEARLVLCNSADSGQIFDHELGGLGFQLKERPWTEDVSVLCQDLCRGRSFADDTSPGQSTNADLADFRISLASNDHARLRSLGHDLAHCVEAAARNCSLGETEAEVAGQLAHRMMKREITPATIQVMADGQGRRYRHWAYGHDRIERFVTLSAVGRRHGLHVGVARTVCFNSPPQELLDWHQHASLVQATGIYFSRAHWSLGDVWTRIARIYEKFGEAEEWRAAEQGEVIGYAPVEHLIVPRSERQLPAGSAIFWHPSVRSSAVGDTVLVREGRVEMLTQTDSWPTLPIAVKNDPVPQPAILCRETPQPG
ncbi:Metallopeptidase family M24 [Caulifigura coniformis]|uniref:Metallopeptidase family M24 n=1 Tax=Caulifigura coniformis TaxID=2527983 RepID=A0A517SB01_9PLAN|nr:M24 family metallopeptidase [Caulifigura coniformis]QDT53307.1 Metallopeptidase family M24 [Caulifigura coniformis]